MFDMEGLTIIAISYKTFKEKIKLTKEYSRNYYIEDLGGVLYMESR